MADRKIVVLDGYTLTPNGVGDEATHRTEPVWDRLAALGDLTVHERTPPEEVAERSVDAEIVLTNKALLPAEVIQPLPDLKYIGVLATGYNVVDLEAAKAAGVVVTNVPAYSTAVVPQHTFALILALMSRVADHSASVQRGEWTNCQDFMYTLSPLTELEGKTLGVIGLGSIGKKVAQIGHAMGMKIAAAHQSSEGTFELAGLGKTIEIDWMSVNELVKQADVVTLHCPLTDQTKHVINAERLATMKSTALVINTGRGPLVDEAALAAALHGGQIAGAGLDVLTQEPPRDGSPLIAAPNCVITPHNAWASVEARHRLMAWAVDNVEAFLAGDSKNVVN